MFRVKLDTCQMIIAYRAGSMRIWNIMIVTGDRVKIYISPYDLTKGRVINLPRREAA